MSKKELFANLTLKAFKAEIIRKLVFSKPQKTEITKVSARLCAHRGRRILALEYSLPSNTVSQKNVTEDELVNEISLLLDSYGQANLLTTAGDAEWKISKSKNEVLLGYDALIKKLSGKAADFERAIGELDKKKNYILTGSEDFLITLGVSDKNGRVHDKKQGKFRQINRFIEHIEDIYNILPKEDTIVIYDLCCGKSYLSFAVYYYLTAVKGRKTDMLCIDIKRDVISWCENLATELNYTGMHFLCDDIKNAPKNASVDMVISLHACDTATDIVIDTALDMNAGIILSTPCCHRYLNDKIFSPELSFITDYPILKNKLCEAATDAIRLARIHARGYKVSALELTDPENTPKNTLLRAVKEEHVSDKEIESRQKKYERILNFLLADKAERYLDEIK